MALILTCHHLQLRSSRQTCNIPLPLSIMFHHYGNSRTSRRPRTAEGLNGLDLSLPELIKLHRAADQRLHVDTQRRVPPHKLNREATSAPTHLSAQLQETAGHYWPTGGTDRDRHIYWGQMFDVSAPQKFCHF